MKKVANTLLSVLDHPIMKAIMDRSKPISENVINEVISWWDYDLYKRKPGPAYLENGTFVGTDLDLACFIYALSRRNAVINIPEYQSMRPTTHKKGQRVLSKENRHGHIIGLTSNQEVFTFSIRINDMNVMSTESVGEVRNYTLTDLNGDWYKGWKKIEFSPTAKENSFLHENKLWSGNSLIFKNFVHPNRWTSFYGHHYFITKALINRLTEEAKFLNTEIKSMLSNGIDYPASEKEKMIWPSSQKEDGKSVKVDAFQVEVDLPENNTKYNDYKQNVTNLVDITKTRKSYVYGIVPTLKFAVRATELSFYKNGYKDGSERFPSWVENAKWERDYVVKGKRNKWDRLVLFQPGVGKVGVSIRKRVYKKSEKVSKNY